MKLIRPFLISFTEPEVSRKVWDHKNLLHKIAGLNEAYGVNLIYSDKRQDNLIKIHLPEDWFVYYCIEIYVLPSLWKYEYLVP